MKNIPKEIIWVQDTCGETLWGFTTGKHLPLTWKVLVHNKDYFGKMPLYFGPLTFVPGCSVFVILQILLFSATSRGAGQVQLFLCVFVSHLFSCRPFTTSKYYDGHADD